MIGLKSTVVCSSVLAASFFVACSDSDSQTSSGSGGTGTTTSTSSTTTATGTTTTSTSTTTGTGGGGPLVCPGAYTDIPTGECDLLQQDCEPGMSCRPFQEMANVWSTHCVAGGGLKGPASPCNTNNECEAGLFCIGPDDLAKCIPVCCEDTNEPCGSGKCNLTVSYGTDNYVMMCSFAPECTLLTANACENGAECHVQDPGLATCVPPSGQQVDEGGTCNFLNDCKDMQHCDNGNICRYYCFTAGSANAPGLGGCPAGQECNPVANFGFPDIGVCRPM